ncbi:MAG TPA: hypothetical protein VII56_14665 [Rhizomicrobium sp.]
MTQRWLTGFALATILITAARAEPVRLPESGDPAFTAQLPDGWTHHVNAEGSLVALSANQTASLTLTILDYDGTLEELAAGAIKSPDGMPPQKSGPVDISGYGGSIFDGALISAAGVHAKVHLLAVKLDDEHVAAATLLTADNLDAAQSDAANAVLKTVALSHKAPEPAAPPAAPAPATPPAEPAPAKPTP